MKKNLVLLLVIPLMVSCNNKGKQNTTASRDSIPSCIRQQIIAFENKTAQNPPIQIDEYIYNGKRVFFFTADCCDQFNTLYDENCNVICSPSGGIEGGGDHKCEGFFNAAKPKGPVWKKTK